MKKLFQFANYYFRKTFSVFFGFHRTRNPLSIRWRWHYWNDNYEDIRRQEKARFLGSGRQDAKPISGNNS